MVYIAGIDGSGKTTLAENLEEYLKKTGKPVRYFYARHFPILMAPVKVLARGRFLSGKQEFGDYGRYVEGKREASRRYPWLARLYALLWILDYSLITYARLVPHMLSQRMLIVDRYFYDVAINISITLGLSSEGLMRLVRTLERFYPLPDSVFFLDIPAEDAFRRKTDIQSVQYLEERRERYQSLSMKFRWVKIDATASREELQMFVIFHLQDAVAR
jgi:thymidylate kinase